MSSTLSVTPRAPRLVRCGTLAGGPPRSPKERAGLATLPRQRRTSRRSELYERGSDEPAFVDVGEYSYTHAPIARPLTVCAGPRVTLDSSTSSRSNSASSLLSARSISSASSVASNEGESANESLALTAKQLVIVVTPPSPLRKKVARGLHRVRFVEDDEDVPEVPPVPVTRGVRFAAEVTYIAARKRTVRFAEEVEYIPAPKRVVKTVRFADTVEVRMFRPLVDAPVWTEEKERRVAEWARKVFTSFA